MEIRRFALRLLETPDLEVKLAPPPAEIEDSSPGPALRVDAPARTPDLAIRAGREARVPPPEGMADPAQRRRLLHAFANHELQAVELFAWALLAFPEAPPDFRRGLLRILEEEQGHARIYVERLGALGGRFGEFPVSGHFWRQAGRFDSPLAFVAHMGLTFENANLDFCEEHAVAARRCGDEETAAILEFVHREEIGHVAFAWRWFRSFRPPGTDDWGAFLAIVGPEAAARSRGRDFDAAARAEAGLPSSFVDALAALAPRAPGGRPR